MSEVRRRRRRLDGPVAPRRLGTDVPIQTAHLNYTLEQGVMLGGLGCDRRGRRRSDGGRRLDETMKGPSVGPS